MLTPSSVLWTDLWLTVSNCLERYVSPYFQIASRRNHVKGDVCQKCHLNSNAVQSCLGPHISFYRLKKTSVFAQDPCNNHTIIILISFFNENECKDLKIIISSYIAIEIAIVVQIIAIRCFFEIVQP